MSFRGALALLCGLASTASGQSSWVRGVVRDSATGRQLGGAIVELRWGPVRRAAQSDNDGEFQVGPVPPNHYRLIVRRLGFRAIERDFPIGAKDTSLVLSLIPIARDLDTVQVRAALMGIYGVVGTAEGLRPLAGARIEVLGEKRGMLTDTAGAFFVPIERTGVHLVRITRPGYEHLLFPVTIAKGRGVDASRLLDSAVAAQPGLAMLWQDLDDRLGRRTMNSALVTGGELRRAGNYVTDALDRVGSFVSRGLFIADEVCVFLNGTPRPGMSLDVISVDRIEAIELYGSGDAAARLLADRWPARARCGNVLRSQGRRNQPMTGARARAIARWAVVWLKPEGGNP
jgi:hypothetical protein